MKQVTEDKSKMDKVDKKPCDMRDDIQSFPEKKPPHVRDQELPNSFQNQSSRAKEKSSSWHRGKAGASGTGNISGNPPSGRNGEENVKSRGGAELGDGSGNGWKDRNAEDLVYEEEDVLPWHHIQLYSFMGKEADYFLYPKPDVEKRTGAKPLVTPLRNKTAYNSVDTLWAALRRESSKKLVRIDNNAPPELKATYHAYIREYRKARDGEDKEEELSWGTVQVPEIEALLDDSQLRRTMDRRRKAQVMFRSSLRNEDRTKILLYNNPLPDVNNHSGEESIIRFLLPAQVVEPSSPGRDIEEFLGRISNTLPRVPRFRNIGGSGEIVPVVDEGSSDPETSWDFISRGGQPKPVRCVFLTEADAGTVGKFSWKRKELMSAKAVDLQYSQKQSAMQDPSVTPLKVDRSRKSSAAEKTVMERRRRKTVEYEPLTIGALMEYTTKFPAPGHGSFRYGTRPMWVVQ